MDGHSDAVERKKRSTMFVLGGQMTGAIKYAGREGRLCSESEYAYTGRTTPSTMPTSVTRRNRRGSSTTRRACCRATAARASTTACMWWATARTTAGLLKDEELVGRELGPEGLRKGQRLLHLATYGDDAYIQQQEYHQEGGAHRSGMGCSRAAGNRCIFCIFF